jgi:DNA polymerase
MISSKTKQQKLTELEQCITTCKKCPLHRTRTHAVVGQGTLSADVLFIGEAPGVSEDKKGKPFVGRAGKLLDELLHAAGVNREDIYITNILKCRPPNNRNPHQSEIATCTSYLDKQIRLIKPSTIVTLGNFATTYLLKKYDKNPQPIGTLHGTIIHVRSKEFTGTIIPLYHPAAAVYNPNLKPVLLKDFKTLS